jgi:predicted secreted hydrolase
MGVWCHPFAVCDDDWTLRKTDEERAEEDGRLF